MVYFFVAETSLILPIACLKLCRTLSTSFYPYHLKSILPTVFLLLKPIFCRPGMRVAVPFGKSKIYTGIVSAVHENAPQIYEA